MLQEAALLSTMELFRMIAIEIAEKHDFQYPQDADNNATAWVTKALHDALLCLIFNPLR